MNSLPLTDAEKKFVREAVKYLEEPTWSMRLAQALGVPLQRVTDTVVPDKVAQLGTDVLVKATDWAAASISGTELVQTDVQQAMDKSEWTGFWHKLASVCTGAAGGTLGIGGLAVELPVTTLVMLRSIVSIAKDFGEELSHPETRLECVSVFGYGGFGTEDATMDSSYLTSRIAMSQLIRDASRFLANSGTVSLAEAIRKGTAPALVKFVGRVAAQFNIRVSQKFLAQGLPLFSIATAATINAAFTDYYSRVARYHFGLRSLERKYGSESVRRLYRQEQQVLSGKTAPRLSCSGSPSSPDED
jgi:hypothetical protein